MANQPKPRVAVIGVGDFYRMLVPGIESAFDVVVRVDKGDFPDEPGGLRDYVGGFSPDAAMILTPNRFHADHVYEVAQLGIPTFVEKPLVTTPEAMARIEESVKLNPALYCSDFYVDVWAVQLLRWMGLPTARCMDQWLDIRYESAEWRDGKEQLGDIVGVEATLLESVGPSSSFVGREWLWDRIHGGVLWDMAYHHLAMWFTVINEPVEVLSVQRTTIPDAPPDASETYGGVEMVSTSGIRFNLRVGKYIETGDDRAFKIIGTKGMVSMDFTEPSRLVLNGNVDAPLGQVTGQRLDYIAPVFREWVESNPITPYGLDAGRQCVETMLRIRQHG
jgi:predicted dehydrogenase